VLVLPLVPECWSSWRDPLLDESPKLPPRLVPLPLPLPLPLVLELELEPRPPLWVPMEVGEEAEPELEPIPEPPVKVEPELLEPPSAEEPLDEELLPGVPVDEPGVEDPVRADDEEGEEDEEDGEVDMLNSWLLPGPPYRVGQVVWMTRWNMAIHMPLRHRPIVLPVRTPTCCPVGTFIADLVCGVSCMSNPRLVHPVLGLP
jgi:hypothetical protein